MLRTIQSALLQVITQYLYRRIHETGNYAHLAPAFPKRRVWAGHARRTSSAFRLYQFLHPGAGVEEDAQQHRIPASRWRGQVGCARMCASRSLKDSRHSTGRVASGGSPESSGSATNGPDLRLHVPEERMQDRQALILRSDQQCRSSPRRSIKASTNVASICASDNRSTAMPRPSRANRTQGEHIAVGLDRVGAQIALCRQVARQEIRQVDGEVCRLHDADLLGMTSPDASLARLTTSGNNSAVRCRYC